MQNQKGAIRFFRGHQASHTQLLNPKAKKKVLSSVCCLCPTTPPLLPLKGSQF